MKQSRDINPWRGFVAAGFACAFLVQTSCEDDPMKKYGGEMTDHPVFEVEVQSQWSAGTAVSRNSDTEIEIDAIDCKLGNKPLWLVTETSAINDSVGRNGEGGMSRGTATTTATFGTEFGLSAICYDGAAGTDLTGWPANFAANEKVTQSGGVWSSSTKDLDWMGSGRLRFFAYAPYEADGLKSSALKLTMTVNSDVKKQTDLLTATADCSGTGGAAVKLGFGHALAAVKVKSGSGMLAGKVTKVTVSGVCGTGEYDMVSGKWTPTGAADSKFETGSGYSADLGENAEKGDDYPYSKPGENITGDGDGLTLFMIPQDLGSGAKLAIEFVDNLTGTSSTLEASIGGTGKKWEAGKLYAYALSTSGIVVTPVVELKNSLTGADLSAEKDSVSYAGVLPNVSMKAYVKITKPKGVTFEKVVPFKVQSMVSTDAEGNSWSGRWTDGLLEPDPVGGVFAPAASAVADADKPQTQVGRLVLEEQPVFNDMREKLITKAAIDAGTFRGNGTVEDPYDLSQGGETANCYMVNKPGYYKIPLYYGNSRNNPSAYTCVDGRTEPGMLYFVDHLNNRIENGKISLQLRAGGRDFQDAMVLWSDSPGLIDHVKLLNEDYIVFRISPYTLSQGNAVIALRDNRGDIVWSWQIWATHYDWSQTYEANVSATDPSTDGGDPVVKNYTFYLAKSFLGYCDSHGASPARRMRIRMVFDLKDFGGNDLVYEPSLVNGDPVKFGQTGVIGSLAGDNTYYQWGRKDAMPGGIYDQVNHAYYQPGSGYAAVLAFSMLNKPIFDIPAGADSESHLYEFSRTPNNDGLSVGEAIRHPQWFVMGTGDNKHRNHWHNDIKGGYIGSGGIMYNMWNSAAVCTGSTDNDKKLTWVNAQMVTKTIYDPSPAGFHVPPAIAYTGIAKPDKGYYANTDREYASNQMQWDESKRCWRAKCNADGSGEYVSIYATGLRDMNLKDADLANHRLPGELNGKSWCAFSMISYICSSTLMQSMQEIIFYIDSRTKPEDPAPDPVNSRRTASICGSNNSYGLTVWPASDRSYKH